MPKRDVIWKPVPGQPGYEVSSGGDIRSWKAERNNAPLPKKPRLLIPGLANGYRQLIAYQNGKRTVLRIRQIVAEVFIGPRPPGAVTRHLNGNRRDDRAVNLRWGTWQENSDDAIRHKTWTHGEDVHTAKLTEKQVMEILKSDLPLKHWVKKYRMTYNSFLAIRLGQTWKHITRKNRRSQ